MNIIPQMSLFDESEFEELGDLERLQMVLDALPDAVLIAKLYKIRGNGRNDWPCEAKSQQRKKFSFRKMLTNEFARGSL